MAMEFLDGVTLKELIRRGPLDVETLIGIAIQVVMAWGPPTREASYIATSSRPTSW